MSNIYNRRLDYEVLPTGKRILQYPTKITTPKYIVVGNTKPNLDYQVNRKLQPIFQTKQPLQQSPFISKQPTHSVGLGGRRPVYIDYIVPPKKPRPAMGLVWEPNSIREQRDNVYPDGLPKNSSHVAQQNSQYLEQQYADKEAKRLEQVIKNIVAGERRPLSSGQREAEVQRLEKMLEERKYVSNPYKNIALSVEGHKEMAEREAKAIKAELQALRNSAADHKDDIVEAITGKQSIKKQREALENLPVLPTYEETTTTIKKLSDEEKKVLAKDIQEYKDDYEEITKNSTKVIQYYSQFEGEPAPSDLKGKDKITERTNFRRGVLSALIMKDKPSIKPQDLESEIDSYMSGVGNKLKYDSINQSYIEQKVFKTKPTKGE